MKKKYTLGLLSVGLSSGIPIFSRASLMITGAGLEEDPLSLIYAVNGIRRFFRHRIFLNRFPETKFIETNFPTPNFLTTTFFDYHISRQTNFPKS